MNEGRKIYMRIVVLSDSHSDAASCEAAIRAHPDAEFVIHLGDGADDLEHLTARSAIKSS